MKGYSEGKDAVVSLKDLLLIEAVIDRGQDGTMVLYYPKVELF